MSEQSAESQFEDEVVDSGTNVQSEGSLENISKNAFEEKADERDQLKTAESVFYAKIGNFMFYNEAHNLKFSKPICTVLNVSSTYFQSKMLLDELISNNVFAEQAEKSLPYGSEVFVNAEDFSVGRFDSFTVAGYIPDKSNQKRCLAIIIQSDTRKFNVVPIDSLRFNVVPKDRMDF